jgi:hypothetical protein
MGARPNKKRSPGAGEGVYVALTVAAVVAVVGVVAIAWMAAAAAGLGQGSPMLWLVDRTGARRWDAAASLWAALYGTAALGGPAGVGEAAVDGPVGVVDVVEP